MAKSLHKPHVVLDILGNGVRVCNTFTGNACAIPEASALFSLSRAQPWYGASDPQRYVRLDLDLRCAPISAVLQRVSLPGIWSLSVRYPHPAASHR